MAFQKASEFWNFTSDDTDIWNHPDVFPNVFCGGTHSSRSRYAWNYFFPNKLYFFVVVFFLRLCATQNVRNACFLLWMLFFLSIILIWGQGQSEEDGCNFFIFLLFEFLSLQSSKHGRICFIFFLTTLSACHELHIRLDYTYFFVKNWSGEKKLASFLGK